MKRTVNKAEFIMSFSSDTPTKDIVAFGKEKGIKFSRNYVSRVRLMKRKSTGASAVRRRGGPRVYPAVAAVATRRAVAHHEGGNEEAAFKRLVVDVGLGRARAMLDEIQNLFASALGDAPRRGPGRPPGSRNAPLLVRPAHGGKSSSRLARRSPDQIKTALASIVSLLKQKKGGLRSEQIQSALKLSKRELLSPIDLGLHTKAIKKKGQRRATTYFV
jgi:hypothetical protein